MVDPIQQRHHDGSPDALGRSERERRLEVGRLRRDPEDVDFALELPGHVDLGLEVAEHGAFDADPAWMLGERLRPEQQDDVTAGACQCAAEQASDPARSQNRVSHRPIVVRESRRIAGR